MKTSIYIITALLILSSCATSNYGKLKYSRVNPDNTQEIKSTHDAVFTVVNNSVDKKEIKQQTNTQVVQSIIHKGRKEIQSKKSTNFTSLRDKLHVIQQDQVIEINTIRDTNDSISDEKKKDPTRIEKRALLFGWLSFIPIPLVGWVFSILAITYGSIALKRLKNGTYLGNFNKAITGLLLGIFTLFVWGIIILLFMASI